MNDINEANIKPAAANGFDGVGVALGVAAFTRHQQTERRRERRIRRIHLQTQISLQK
jgi:hypothetical protein